MNLESTTSNLCRIDKKLIGAGALQLLPLSLFVLVFALAFGIAASQTGLDPLSSLAMSALVFAGASQFAALELWGTQVPFFTLLATVLAINARHLLMGATLYPWLVQLPAGKRYAAMLLATDANWAMSLQAFSCDKPGFGLLIGGGISLWLSWVLGSWLGIHFGHTISDPYSLGIDMVLGCFLLAMVVGGEKNTRTFIIWAIAAISALLAYRFLPENSHVIVGALAGGLAGACMGRRGNEH